MTPMAQGEAVVLYRWPDYEMARAVSKAELHIIGDNSGLKVPALTTSMPGPGIFLLRRRGGNSSDVVALFVVEDFEDAQFEMDQAWMRNRALPKTGQHRYTIWSVDTKRPSPQALAAALTERETALAATFFFDWLGLNPQYLRSLPRLYFKVPFAVDPGPLTATPTALFLPTVFTSQGRQLTADHNFNEWVRTMAKGWLEIPELFILPFISYPNKDTVRMHNRFVEITLQWSTETTQFKWRAELHPLLRDECGVEPFTPWQSSLGEAIVASGLVTTWDGLEEWLDTHTVPGEPMVDLEPYIALDVDVPPLYRWADFVRWAKAAGVMS